MYVDFDGNPYDYRSKLLDPNEEALKLLKRNEIRFVVERSDISGYDIIGDHGGEIQQQLEKLRPDDTIEGYKIVTSTLLTAYGAAHSEDENCSDQVSDMKAFSAKFNGIMINELKKIQLNGSTNI